MVGTDTYTPNLRLTKIGGDRKNWNDVANNNYTILDGILSAFFTVSNMRGLWENSTAYAVGDAAVDPQSAVVYVADVAHTSAMLPTLFAADRAANPTYWSLYAAPAQARGVWTGPGTSYITNDFVLADGTKYAMCVVPHTSGATFAADLALGYWVVLIDLSTAGTFVLPVLSGAADALKYVATNALGTAYEIINSTEAMSRLSGILPIVKGGTGTSTGTGSGNVVLSDSPTLTGSPAAPKQVLGTVTDLIATCSFVADALAAGASISVGDAPPVAPADNMLWWSSLLMQLFIYYDDGDTTQWVPASAPAASVPIVQNYLSGCTLTNSGALSIAFAAGQWADSGNARMYSMSSITKALNSAWAAGNGSGGLATGAIAANTTYHCFGAEINGLSDAFFDTSATGANAPVGTTYMRRLGGLRTDGTAANIIPFTQDGDEFWLRTPVQDISATNPGTAAVTRTLTSIPTGIRVRAIINASLQIGADGDIACGLITDLSNVDAAPSESLYNFGGHAARNSASLFGAIGSQPRVFTNTSAQVRSRINNSTAGTVVRIQTFGWVDRRGRDG
jgi:hypothetical protein